MGGTESRTQGLRDIFLGCQILGSVLGPEPFPHPGLILCLALSVPSLHCLPTLAGDHVLADISILATEA